MNQAIAGGFNAFKHYIQAMIEKDKEYLSQFFWVPGGGQQTVLNYLIQLHQEPQEGGLQKQPNTDFTDLIEYVLSQSLDAGKIAGEPIHQAVNCQKFKLACHLIDSYDLDLNQRDTKGRTLLASAIYAKNTPLLQLLLAKKVNLHATTLCTPNNIPYQPLHQAIAVGYTDGVYLLVEHGAQLANPVGPYQETPVLFAANRGQVAALNALLENPASALNLEAVSNAVSQGKENPQTAIEILCQRVIKHQAHEEALRGVAMLLVVGAEPPRELAQRQLLNDNRLLLLKVIALYLENRPELVDGFVHRCHLKDSPLHDIVYADHSWGGAMRQLWGKPCEAALKVEELVNRKYSRSRAAFENTEEQIEKSPHRLYAEFVNQYTHAYDNQYITNRWSTMRWMIAQGQCNWESVLKYSANHPNSRTQIIIDEMLGSGT